MLKLTLGLMLTVASPAFAGVETNGDRDKGMTARDRIKAERVKAADDRLQQDSKRPWDAKSQMRQP